MSAGQQKGGNAWEAEEPDMVNQGPATIPQGRSAMERRSALGADADDVCLHCRRPIIKDRPYGFWKHLSTLTVNCIPQPRWSERLMVAVPATDRQADG